MYNRDIGQKELIKRLDEQYNSPSHNHFVKGFNNAITLMLGIILAGALAYEGIFKKINYANQLDSQPTSDIRRVDLDSLTRETERQWDESQKKQYKKWREQSEEYLQ